jgi:hypothetical protein
MIMRCNNNSGPTNPTDKVPGTAILSEGFEGDLSNYRQITYDPAQGMMSISTQHAHSGKSSLTSDSNNTGIKRGISPSIDDSIAGLQFYLMATKTAHTNFFAAICRPGSSADGLITKFGMGIDKSDSLNYICYDYLNGINEYKNFAPLTLNKWYKCKIEYDYTDTTLTYFLDNDTIYTRTTPSTLTPFQTFVAIRDGLGAQGPSGYYIDDVTIYKR